LQETRNAPLPDQAAIPKKDIFYIISGFVQQTVQIVVRYALTIYPYSLFTYLTEVSRYSFMAFLIACRIVL